MKEGANGGQKSIGESGLGSSFGRFDGFGVWCFGVAKEQCM